MNINGKYIKRGTIITVVSIIVLTLATMNVSYSSFFSVQTQSTVPVITAGNLNVTAEVTDKDTGGEGLSPSGGYNEIKNEGSPINGTENTDYIKSTLTVTNKSNLKVTIGVSLSNTATAEDNGGNAAPEDVVIAIQRDNKWITFGSSSSYHVQLNNLTQSDSAYPIIKDDIEKSSDTTGTKAVYDIYMWVKEDAGEDSAEKALNYSIGVKAVPAEGQNTDNQIKDISTNAS